MSEGGSATPRAQPFYCPYCGEGDFEPAGDEAGHYFCSSCERHWRVVLLGIGSSAGSRSEPPLPGDS